MHFEHPTYLLILLLIPVYAVAVLRARHAGFGVSTFTDLRAAMRQTPFFLLPLLRHALISLIIILFAITLARPQSAYTEHKVSKKGIDIVIALDVSYSMLAEDISPNRLEAAKAALKQFVRTRENDRVGIVIFAGAPFTQSPLTFDYDAIEYFVDRITTDSITQGRGGLSGTAIGDAILASLNRLKESGDREKVIILISDGEANVGIDPIVAARKANEMNVRIYTIGVGNAAPIPYIDAMGNKRFARNRDGSLFLTTFDEKTMRAIAEISGGSFFKVDDTAGYEQALRSINNLEKRDIEITETVRYSDAFSVWLYALGAAFMCFVGFESFLRIKQ